MKKLFICLANSKKYGGRCLAGIEVRRDENGVLQIIRDARNLPLWIRPVSHSEYGEIPDKLVRHLQLCDLVSFDAADACPHGYQQENTRFEGTIFEKSGYLKIHRHNLIQLTDNREGLLGNHRKQLNPSEIAALDHSIVLIHVEPPGIRLYEIGATHLRIVFRYQQAEYDLPVTDIDFYLRWIDAPGLLADKSDVFLCVSLSREKEGFYYKLVAGVLEV